MKNHTPASSVPEDTAARIATPTGASLRPALALALGEGQPGAVMPRTLAVLAAAELGELSLAGLRQATREGQLVGAAWCQVMSGRVAAVDPVRVVGGENAATAERLAAEREAYLTEEQVSLAQAVLPHDAPEEQLERLTRFGYTQVAELLYLVALLDRHGVVPESNGELSYEPFRLEEHERFTKLIAATYEGSLDCPAIDGRRDMADVLAGYESTGEFAPERWLIVRHEGRDVGCLLLADFPAHEHWELVYMGIVPTERGRGWGAVIAQQAQSLARAAGRKRLVLAVDAANRPALGMYLRTGFELWDRRRVWLKFYK